MMLQHTTSEALILTIDPTLLLNEVTAANAPRKGPQVPQRIS
jgi:hypothetical protein